MERTAQIPQVAPVTDRVAPASLPCVDVKQHHAPASCVEFSSEQSPIEFNQAINYVNKIKVCAAL